MGVYDRQIASVQRVIRAKGESCVWHPKPTVEVADATKPWIEDEAAGAPVTYPDTRIAMFPLDRRYAELIRFMKDTELVIGGLYGLMGVVSFTPEISGVVERKDGTKLGIISINPFAPNGDVIFYTVEFKT